MVVETRQAPAGTQAIGRALAVLRALAGSADEHEASAIAADLDLSAGTTKRILGALVAESLVAQNPTTGRYYLASGAILLGQAAQRGFGLDKALPVLEELNAETSESVNLVVREGDESVVMMRVQSTLPLRFEQHPGARFPLYSTASGKAMLTHSPDADAYIDSLPQRLPPLTDNTLPTPERLATQLQQTRERGYSVDDEENVAGVRCVGAAVLDSYGRAQAAITIQVPTVRMPKRRTLELGERVQLAGKEVARFVPVDRTMST